MNYLKRNWLIILILILATFTRLYRLPATITFLEDEGRDLLIAHRMIDTHRPVLLGPQTSTGNMYLGPLYYYLITPWLFAFQGSPIGPVIFIALTGILTVYLLYRFGLRWFSPRVGYLAALLYALMPLPVQFSRNSWNPNLVPLISLLLVWTTLHLSSHPRVRRLTYFAGLGALVGILVQLHYMALIFVAALGLLNLFLWRKQLKSFTLGVLVSLVAFAAVLSPFIVFEIRNNFVNTKAITSFIKADREKNIRYSLPFWLWEGKVAATGTKLLGSQLGRGALSPDVLSPAITVIALTLIIFGLWSTPIYRMIAFLFILPLLTLGIYQESIHLHYIGFFFPLTYLLIASLIDRGKLLSRLAILFVIYTLIYSIPSTLSYISSGPTNQVIRASEVSQYIVKESAGRPYNMVSSGKTHTTPYLYFSAISPLPPVNTHAPLLFLICQDNPCSDEDINSPLLYITGPAHPTLVNYLGHPLYNYYDQPRTLIKMEHVSHGVWVAEINVKLVP
ncbi:MAG: glycosyltransferase family 39 protein [bacterium]